MIECNSIEAPNLNDQQQFRLKKVNGIKDCFITEIKERELMSKRFSKYVASFDYLISPYLFYLQQVAAFLLHYLQLLLEHLPCSFNVFRNYKEIVKNNNK